METIQASKPKKELTIKIRIDSIFFARLILLSKKNNVGMSETIRNAVTMAYLKEFITHTNEETKS
jgi:hypothetical protein